MISNRNTKGQMVSVPFEIRLKEQLDSVIITDTGCWIWQGARAGGGGYPTIRNKDNKPTRVSRIMLELNDHPQPSEAHIACHRCDTPACVNPAHLFWGTHKENTKDASIKGRLNKPVGEHLEKIKRAVKELWTNKEFRNKHSEMMSLRNTLMGKKDCHVCKLPFREYQGSLLYKDGEFKFTCNTCFNPIYLGIRDKDDL